VKRRPDREPPEFTAREQALLAVWDERNAPPADAAFHDQLLAGYGRAEQAALRSSEAADAAICLQIASSVAFVDALDDLEDPDGSHTRAVPVDVAAILPRAGGDSQLRLRRSARRRLAAAIAVAAAVVVASLRPRSDAPAPALPRSAAAVDDTHSAAAGAAPPHDVPSLEIRPPVALPAGTDRAAQTIEIRVHSAPSGAEVWLDGLMVGYTPFAHAFSRTTSTARLRLHLARYQDVTATVDRSADYRGDLTLKPLAPRPAPVAKVEPLQPCDGKTINPFEPSGCQEMTELIGRAKPLVLTALARSQAGDHAGAIESYYKAWAIEGNPLLLANIAAEYEQDNKPVEALTYYCRYLARDPDGADAPLAASHARLLHARLINAQLEPGNESERVGEICASYTAKSQGEVDPRGDVTSGGGGGRRRGETAGESDPPK